MSFEKIYCRLSEDLFRFKKSFLFLLFCTQRLIRSTTAKKWMSQFAEKVHFCTCAVGANLSSTEQTIVVFTTNLTQHTTRRVCRVFIHQDWTCCSSEINSKQFTAFCLLMTVAVALNRVCVFNHSARPLPVIVFICCCCSSSFSCLVLFWMSLLFLLHHCLPSLLLFFFLPSWQSSSNCHLPC